MFDPAAWVHNNPFYTLGAWYVYSAAVSAMPEPNSSGKLYLWFYRFTHLLAGNIDKVMSSSQTTATK